MKTLFLFITLHVVGVTAFGQSSTQDSCICYTDAQDIRCLECLMNYPILVDKCDDLRLIISEREIQLGIASELISDQSIVIADLQAKLSESERKRANLKKVFIVTVGVVGIETLLLLILK